MGSIGGLVLEWHTRQMGTQSIPKVSPIWHISPNGLYLPILLA